MAQAVITVSALNQYIKRLMEQDTLLYQLLVRGEISNFKHHSSGHMYFTLKDEQCSIKTVMFKGQNQYLKFKPTDGMKVIICGRVSVFEREGVYQLYAEDMQPDGLGALHIAFEQLKKKLLAEGLFSAHRKKPIPQFPEKIGVVTSPTGAAIRDIIQVLQRRYPYGEILIFPVSVQGGQASKEIAKAIELMNKHRACEVMIVGRGGGSIEDLWAFNEELVARAIAESKIPIISAVGHETDFTIADFVADLRAPTPSAAAELVATSGVEVRQIIEQMTNQLNYHMEKKVNIYRLAVKRQILSLVNPRDRLLQNRLVLDNGTTYLIQTMKDYLNQYRERLNKNVTKLKALNPVAVLARGYAIAKNEQGDVVKSVNQVNSEEKVSIQVYDGEIVTRTIETKPKT